MEITVAQSDMCFIFFDDFPDGTSEEWQYTEPYDPDFVEEYYNHPTMAEYLDEYFERKNNGDYECGCNKYALVGDMILNGNSYWLYRPMPDYVNLSDDGSTNPAGALLLKTKTKADIYPHSLAASYDNLTEHFPAFDAYLQPDGTEYEGMVEREGAETYQLVDIQ
jgi:hypothetical protein